MEERGRFGNIVCEPWIIFGTVGEFMGFLFFGKRIGTMRWIGVGYKEKGSLCGWPKPIAVPFFTWKSWPLSLNFQTMPSSCVLVLKKWRKPLISMHGMAIGIWRFLQIKVKRWALENVKKE